MISTYSRAGCRRETCTLSKHYIILRTMICGDMIIMQAENRHQAQGARPLKTNVQRKLTRLHVTCQATRTAILNRFSSSAADTKSTSTYERTHRLGANSKACSCCSHRPSPKAFAEPLRRTCFAGFSDHELHLHKASHTCIRLTCLLKVLCHLVLQGLLLLLCVEGRCFREVIPESFYRSRYGEQDSEHNHVSILMDGHE